MDQLQSEALLSHLVKNKLISAHQFGFLPYRCTAMQLVYIPETWLHSLEGDKGTVAIFINFYKAFDRVWQTGLPHKLSLLGVNTSSIDWLNNYLLDRVLHARVGSAISRTFPLSAGVPGGSHLGLVLFLAFINDLPATIPSPSELYADDALLHQHCSAYSFLERLQQSITSAESWELSWHGRFGHRKTVALPIGTHAKSACLSCPVKIEGQSVQLSDVPKRLGVYLSGDLSWSPHLSSVNSKSTEHAGLLRHMACKISPELVTKLYLSFVRPILEYASPSWHFSISASEALAMERIQASVARKVLRADWLTSKATLLRQLNWPSLRWRLSVACSTLFHKRITEPSPPLSECLVPFSSELSARPTREPLQLVLSRCKSSKPLKSHFPILSHSLEHSPWQPSKTKVLKHF